MADVGRADVPAAGRPDVLLQEQSYEDVAKGNRPQKVRDCRDDDVGAQNRFLVSGFSFLRNPLSPAREKRETRNEKLSQREAFQLRILRPLRRRLALVQEVLSGGHCTDRKSTRLNSSHIP